MARSMNDLGPQAWEMLRERHLGSLTTLRADGTPHVVAVGFTADAEAGLVRVITSEGTQKAVNAERGGYGAVNHVDGARWLTLEGPARVLREPDQVCEAEQRYAQRYREPRPNPRRVVIEVTVARALGSARMFDQSPTDAP